MQEFEVHGQWWLPGQDQHKVPGTLRHNESGTLLTLLGALRPEVDIFTSDDEATYPRLYGYAGGRPFTLEDCFQKQMSTQGGFTSGTIFVNQVFKNFHFSRDEEIQAEGITFTPRYLNYWVNQQGISLTHRAPNYENPDPDDPHVTLQGREIPPQAISLFDGTLELRHRLYTSGDGLSSRKIRQRFYFRYEASKLLSTQELLYIASYVQDLVSIGTNRIAQFEEVTFIHPDARYSGPETPQRPIEFFARWHAWMSEPLKPPAVNMFDLSDIGGMAGVAEWAKSSSNNRLALARVTGSRYMKSMPLSDRILNTAAALESFDRTKHRDSIEFRRRMARCANYAGAEFTRMIGRDRSKWAKLVKEARDDVAHNLGISRETTTQLFLYESLQWLFILCLLKDSKAPKEAFQSITRHAEFDWLCKRVSSEVATA
ncbi:HEPN domain-containing protein [Streptomyces sp. NPDC001581]|uniref:ApeA N-terminal domain 1-containing protein n=1 Tax=Streptomyces sp. NPDC001581 TaxID=3154386 RepID=UPI003333666C